MSLSDYIGITIFGSVLITCLVDLWRFETPLRNKLIFSFILLFPILGFAFYLIARPDLAGVKHDSETNNCYPHGWYEQLNEKHNMLKILKREQNRNINNADDVDTKSK